MVPPRASFTTHLVELVEYLIVKLLGEGMKAIYGHGSIECQSTVHAAFVFHCPHGWNDPSGDSPTCTLLNMPHIHTNGLLYRAIKEQYRVSYT